MELFESGRAEISLLVFHRHRPSCGVTIEVQDIFSPPRARCERRDLAIAENHVLGAPALVRSSAHGQGDKGRALTV